MAHEPVERKLTAILFADVKGYSRLMNEDEALTLENLQLFRVLITSYIERHHGRVVGAPGDALLAEFGSVVDAVEGAIEIQRELRIRNSVVGPSRRMEFRIGINLGDVIVSEDSLYGDSVNIAARMESLALPGGICITGTVYEHIKNKFPVLLESIGERTVKNIADPINVYRVLLDEPEGKTPTFSAGSAERGGPTKTHRQRRPALWPFIITGVSLIFIIAVLIVPTEQDPFDLIDNGKIDGLNQPQKLPSKEKNGSAPTESKIKVLSHDTALQKHRPGAVAVMNFKPLAAEERQAWMGEAIRDNFNSQFRRLSGLEVYSKEYIDFLMQEGDITEIEIAKELGIAKMISGSFVSASDTLRIETHVVDVQTGLLETSAYVVGDLNQFFSLQQELAVKIMHAFHPAGAMEDVPLVASAPASSSLESYRLLMEAEDESGDLASGERDDKSSLLELDHFHYGSILRRLGTWAEHGNAWADPEAGPTLVPQKEIEELLEIYRMAYERKSLGLLERVYEVMSDKQRAARVRYFENTSDLQVIIQDVRIAVRGDSAIVSYTREDQFKDIKTGRDVKVDVRLTKSLARIKGKWKIIRKKR